VREIFYERRKWIRAKLGGYRVYVNPPYGREIEKWIRKAYEERNNADVIVLLLPARTDTRYFHKYIYGKSEVHFLKGRLHFNESLQGAPFPSMIVVYKPELI